MFEKVAESWLRAIELETAWKRTLFSLRQVVKERATQSKHERHPLALLSVSSRLHFMLHRQQDQKSESQRGEPGSQRALMVNPGEEHMVRDQQFCWKCYYFAFFSRYLYRDIAKLYFKVHVPLINESYEDKLMKSVYTKQKFKKKLLQFTKFT